jgi:uncharacterized protein (TIGR02147 family)
MFLDDSYRWHKNNNRTFSHRYINQKVNATSSGWFAGVVKGTLNLTSTYRHQLADVFKLDEQQKQYFEALIDYNQAGTSQESKAALRRLVSLAQVKATVVGKEKFEFYSTWYIPAIRELLFFFDFCDDYPFLASKLAPAISIDEAVHSIEVLKSLDMIRTNTKGYLKPCDPIIKKDSSSASLYWLLYMQSNIELSEQAIKRFPKDKRNISACTASFSKEGFALASQKVDEFRATLLKLSEEDKHRDKVYQCNIQLFPLTD